MEKEELKKKLLSFMGLENESEEEKEKIFLTLENYLWLKLNFKIMERLSPAERKELEDLRETEKIQDFISQRIPDLDNLMESAAKEGVSDLKLSLG